MKSLIKKYDRPGPRYTSYPPVPFWTSPPSEEEWLTGIEKSLRKDPRLDIYLHVPYCEQLCYYCGCNRVITKDKHLGRDYVQYLLKEWWLYQQNIEISFSVNSIHFGGGTPTFLSPASLATLLSNFKSRLTYDFIGAVEVDPRNCTKDHLLILRHFGFQRLSLGIQDFDDNVQTKINRKQSFHLVSGLVEEIRRQGFESVNFDLIYGLPGQTQETISKTIELVTKLAPDTVAYYSYAHLPDRIPNQRLIKNSDLPTPEAKLELYLMGQDLLSRAGYVHIGMDHFALPGSFLTKEITRSFMGYTDKKSPLLLGLGASSIGGSTDMFIQNEKDVKKYMDVVGQKKFPIVHGHRLSREEKEISHFIQDLFCQGEVTLPQYFREQVENEDRLIELERDGLIVWKNHQRLIVTPLGKNFLRNIAMAIDPLLRTAAPVRFSNTI